MNITPEGFGANVIGGEGGVEVWVTSLADSGPGTLREACLLAEDRHIQFAVNGVVELLSPIRFVQPNVTIDGSTAPGDGVCIKGKLDLTTNSILHHLRVRQGLVGMGDCVEVWGADFLADHCSLSWAGDENIGFHRNAQPRNTTVQWCIINEGIKGLLASYGTHGVTFHHNLFAGNYIRSPFVGSSAADPEDPAADFDIRNNVIYNIGNSAVDVTGQIKANVVGNYFREKKGTTRLHRYCVVLEGDPPPETIQIYVDGNYGPVRKEGDAEWNQVRYHDVSGWGVADESKYRASTPFACPSVATESASSAYLLVLASAGATLPMRDSVDRRVTQEVWDGTGICPVGSSEGAYRTFAAEQWETLSYEGGEEPMAEHSYDPASQPFIVGEGLPRPSLTFVRRTTVYDGDIAIKDEDGLPVAGVTITVDGKSAVTSASGQCVIEGVAAGNYMATPQV